FFAPRGAPVPQAGDAAIWVLRRRPLWRLQRCSEQQSLTSAACPYDIGLTLDSDDDIRPIAEWPRLRAVLRTLRLGPASSTAWGTRHAPPAPWGNASAPRDFPRRTCAC